MVQTQVDNEQDVAVNNKEVLSAVVEADLRLIRFTEALSEWVEKGEWSLSDAKRVSTAIGSENAINAYSLEG